MSERACEGGRVLEAPHEMAECVDCGSCVRWDLQDDSFWGFRATCPITNPHGEHLAPNGKPIDGYPRQQA